MTENAQKFKTIIPNNTIYDNQRAIPVTALQAPTNQLKTMERLQTATDIKLSVISQSPIGQTSVVRMTSINLLYEVWLEMEIDEAVGGSVVLPEAPFFGHLYIDTVSYKFPGSERVDYNQWMLLPMILEGCQNEDQKELYKRVSGSTDAANPRIVHSGVTLANSDRKQESSVDFTVAYKPKMGRKVSILLPIPGSTLNSTLDGRAFPLPLYLMSQPFEITIKWVNTYKYGIFNNTSNVRGDLSLPPIKNIKLCYKYGDFASQQDYSRTVQNYRFMEYYGMNYDTRALEYSKGIIAGILEDSTSSSATGSGFSVNTIAPSWQLGAVDNLSNMDSSFWLGKKRTQTITGFRPGETTELMIWFSPLYSQTPYQGLKTSAVAGAAKGSFWMHQRPRVTPYFGTPIMRLYMYINGARVYGWDNPNELAMKHLINRGGTNSFKCSKHVLQPGKGCTIPSTVILQGTHELICNVLDIPTSEDGFKSKGTHCDEGYYYKISLAELDLTYLQNRYSMGTDLSGAEVRIEYWTGSADFNMTMPSTFSYDKQSFVTTDASATGTVLSGSTGNGTIQNGTTGNGENGILVGTSEIFAGDKADYVTSIATSGDFRSLGGRVVSSMTGPESQTYTGEIPEYVRDMRCSVGGLQFYSTVTGSKSISLGSAVNPWLAEIHSAGKLNVIQVVNKIVQFNGDTTSSLQ